MRMIVHTADLVSCLADAIDLINTHLSRHNRTVLCLAHAIGVEYGLGSNQLENLVVAAAVHDIGALTFTARNSIMDFEVDDPLHAHVGCRLLSGFRPFAHVAPIVKHHHGDYRDVSAHGTDTDDPSIESRIIHLADRIAVLVSPQFQLGDAQPVVDMVQQGAGSRFDPNLIEVFQRLSRKESFWLNARSAESDAPLEETLARNIHLYASDMVDLGEMLAQVIDFRSSFTATHSSGVSAVAAELGSLIGFSENQCVMIRVAGLLHDIGKLTIPESILNSPEGLSPEEYNLMRGHTYYTDRLLRRIREFDLIRVWGSLHHERLDGTGYPFRLRAAQIPLCSRIMAVADVYTAVSEDRPYRKGMQCEKVTSVLRSMVASGGLEQKVVELLLDNYPRIESVRSAAQENALRKYKEFYRQVVGQDG